MGLPKGFCLINVPKACLVETDGIQVPKYAGLSYVWGKSDEEIITTKENFESLKVQGRFRERDVLLTRVRIRGACGMGTRTAAREAACRCGYPVLGRSTRGVGVCRRVGRAC